jgi:hypothetical protein
LPSHASALHVKDGVTVVPHWCYSDVTVVLQWCYSFVTCHHTRVPYITRERERDMRMDQGTEYSNTLDKVHGDGVIVMIGGGYRNTTRNIR